MPWFRFLWCKTVHPGAGASPVATVHGPSTQATSTVVVSQTMPPPAPPLSPPLALFQIVTGLWAAQATATFARLGVADHLADGPRTALDLAPLLAVDARALHRLLRALVPVGVVTADEAGRFALTAVGDLLRDDALFSMRATLVAETDTPHWSGWGRLDEAVRTGRAWRETEPETGADVWSYYRTHPEAGRQFARSMSGISWFETMAILAAISFAEARTIVDVGGSEGAFLAAVLGAAPSARGVLFDLPEVIATGAPMPSDIAGRVERHGGSFLDGVPAGGDVYLLKHILHDWPDNVCVRVLGHVRAAMSPGARVIVAEMLIDPHDATSATPLLDLNMLAVAGGQERTAKEYESLFARAGLRLASVTPTTSPVSVLEAR